MTSLVTSDLHFNDTARDSYRWEILPWLENEALRQKVDHVLIAGDITDAKDRHPATLVNRIGDFFAHSKNRWVIVTGNHDRISEDNPFFRWLDHLENVTWVVRPSIFEKLRVDGHERRTLILPATRNWELEWAPYLEQKFTYIFVHATFEDTMAENGYIIPGGVPRQPFRDNGALVYAGDIHTQQKLDDWGEYIGAPYRVHFGDRYTPRVLYFGKDGIEDIHPPMLSRHVIVLRSASDLEFDHGVAEGDQVKIRVRLKRSEFPEWRKIRNEVVSGAEALGWQVCGIELSELSSVRRRLDDPQEEGALPNSRKSPEQYARDYGASQNWSKSVIDFGVELLKPRN